MDDQLSRCLSSLHSTQSRGLKSMLLTSVGLQITCNENQITKYTEQTLIYLQQSVLDVDLGKLVRQAIQELVDERLVSRSSEGALVVTDLGRATFKGNMDTGIISDVNTSLRCGLKSLVLVSHLHLLYLVTPLSINAKINWMFYFEELNNLSECDLKILEYVGISQGIVADKAMGKHRKNTIACQYDRFYLTLMLYRLWRQESVWNVSSCFDVTRGFVQQLLTMAASHASSVHRFADELPEFWAYQDVLPNFVKKLSYCVSAELIPIMQIQSVSQARAKQLYTAGYKTIQLIAYADCNALVRNIEFLSYKNARQIISSAELLLKEQVEELCDEVNICIKPPTDLPL